MTRRRLPGFVLAALLLGAAGCTPDIDKDPVPEALEFDTEATPPRVPAPTGLIVNPATGHLDFALAGIELPDDCSDAVAVSPAECAFDRYLETLDGFPTVTPATAPATSELDTDTLTPGENVVIVALGADAPPELALGFEPDAQVITLAPIPRWSIGQTYFAGVRGYAGGVRAASGAEVVGSPTMALLKQPDSLTCGAASPDEIDAKCPALRLLAEQMPEEAARANVATLEAIRSTYAAIGLWDRFEQAGLPKHEIAVAWGFPIHSGSVAEVDPTAGLVPEIVAGDQIRVGVQGPVDPATVTGFVVRERPGSVVLMDLTAAAGGDLVAGFPRVEAAYEDGAVVITGSEPFEDGHQYGVFMTNEVQDPDGAPLVPAPISVLLSLTYPLVADGHSTISTVADADATLLELGRTQLADLFDNPVFAPLTGVRRDNLVYCFAFAFEAP